ncbi:unnamed protein product [Echinostoma caproni]|uniref:Miff domain-containing protein n=1 Tax=Echinostoma caproni TaxID=27848 RepID=A0A183AIN1_9TREM|nr:unnamed protein product [Echinostoma caproni]
MYEREFIDYNPSDETMSLEDRKALSIVENVTLMSDGHLQVPMERTSYETPEQLHFCDQPIAQPEVEASTRTPTRPGIS